MAELLDDCVQNRLNSTAAAKIRGRRRKVWLKLVSVVSVLHSQCDDAMVCLPRTELSFKLL